MAENSILLVDDDSALCSCLKEALVASDYRVALADSGVTALESFHTAPANLVILDISLPTPGNGAEMDGLQVLEKLRHTSEVPVLMLSSTSIPTVKVMALEMGADDYLTKPFDERELVARVRALFRRNQGQEPAAERIVRGDIELSPGERKVWKRGAEIVLTAREFDLLHVLSARPGHVFTRDALFELAWHESHVGVSKGVDVHIANLRKKIEDTPGEPVFIETVRGVGYRFECARP